MMEGVCRPGFFQGVMTVVLKLLNLVRPERAYFGEKDYQQLRVIKEMVQRVFYSDGDRGVSYGSRRVGPRGKFPKCPSFCRGKGESCRYGAGLCQAQTCAKAAEMLEGAGFLVEYVEEHFGRRFAAARLEGVRLIDNVPARWMRSECSCVLMSGTVRFSAVFTRETIYVLLFGARQASAPPRTNLGCSCAAVLRENSIEPDRIAMAAICSVVPDVLHSLRNCFRKYFSFEPFILQPGAKTGLKIRYRNPLEVGADKIANAVGGLFCFPGKNLLIIDFGTATTLCAVTKNKEYLGGIITPGIYASMELLESKTARLPAVEIVRPKEILGRSAVESIQSGLY